MRFLAIASLVATTACTSDFECYSDRACGEAHVCDGGVCKPGERGGVAGGDSAGDTDIPLDTFGPLISITSPQPYELVAGVINIKATVLDQVVVSAEGRREVSADGVDTNGVTAVIAGIHVVPMAPAEGNEEGRFEGDFDTRVLGMAGFPSLVVTARDVLGNRGEVGTEFALDNREPIAALESRPVQFYRISPSGPQEGAIECSRIFNPLGDRSPEYPGAVEHGDVIGPVSAYPASVSGLSFVLRARIQDQGNGLFPGIPIPRAGVAGTQPEGDNTHNPPRVFMLDRAGLDPSGANRKLLITENSTGKCMLNPAIIPDPGNPRPEQAIVQNLVEGGPAGEPNFAKFESAVIPANSPCDYGGWEPPPDADDVDPAPLICGAVDPTTTMWMNYTTGPEPAIWMLNTFSSDTLSDECAGGVFDANNFTQDGEVCLVVTAEDNLGNRTVSQPIAICVDRVPPYTNCVGFSRATVDPVGMCTDGCAADANPNRPADFGVPDDPIPEMRFWQALESTQPDPDDPTGACCANGNCLVLPATDCLANAGAFQGVGTDCGSTTCPP